MKQKRVQKIAAVTLLVVFILGGLWYYRPMDIYSLAPGLKPDIISVSISKHEPGAFGNMEQRNLEAEVGQEGFEALLYQLETIQFRRPPINLLLQAFPFLEYTDSKVIEDPYYYHISIGLANEESETWDLFLSFWIDEWGYRDFDHNVSLSLTVPEGKAIGHALGDEWWEIATLYESNQ